MDFQIPIHDFWKMFMILQEMFKILKIVHHFSKLIYDFLKMFMIFQKNNTFNFFERLFMMFK
jgi:hypothetical protein